MARIDSLIPGRDGHPRAATITLRGRTTRRPIGKLYQLEASQHSTQDGEASDSGKPLTVAAENESRSEEEVVHTELTPAIPTVITRSGRVSRPPK